ncbi:MAG: DUF4062 domain-containing protein [Methanoregula sp.]|jgi:hypothetical protein
MIATWKTVRVFISSTFRDMQAERDHLVRFVFPHLREQLLPQRIHLVDVDLRWGVTSEQDALQFCREIVDECHPRFLCMLGDRYGSVPRDRNYSITADEVHYGVLDRSVEKRGFAYFYFRDDITSATMVETNPGEFREPEGSDTEKKLNKLKQDIKDAGLNPFTYPAQWDNKSRRLTGLKKFGDRVYIDLLTSITSDPELQDRFANGASKKPDEFADENAMIEAFVEERCQRFVLGSRETVLNELLTYIFTTESSSYVCLTGLPGSGKSALLAYLSRHSALNSKESVLLIRHFVGASPGSTDIRRTLRRLCHELKMGCPAITADIPEESEKLAIAFLNFLRQACVDKRVVILLDAVNQFDLSLHSTGLYWLPEELPEGARIILSALDGPLLEELPRRSRKPYEIELKPLTRTDGEAIIEQFLKRYHKQLVPDQRGNLLAKTDAGMPLYLLAALEELRTLGNYEEITQRIAELPLTTQELFTWILERLENDDGFRDPAGKQVGLELVSRFSALLSSSRHGLSQRELADLLAPGDVKAKPPIEPDSEGNVAALLHLLRPYLMHRGELLDFYHRQFRIAAEGRYLKAEEQRLESHRLIATYFQGLACPDNPGEWNKAPIRALSELPYQLTHIKRDRSVEHLLCDLIFIEASISNGLLDQFLGDLHVASQLGMPEVGAVRNAMLSSVAAIRQRPHLALQTIINRIRNEPVGSTLKAHLKCAEALMNKRGLWLCSMTSFDSNRRLIKGVIALSPQRRVFHVLNEQNEIECHELDTQQLIERHAPFHGRDPINIIIHPLSGRIVWMDSFGNIYNGFNHAPVRLRIKESCLSFLGCGVVGVDPEDTLIFIDLESQFVKKLVESINRTSAKIFTNSDCTGGIVISGDRIPSQRIFLLKSQGNIITVDEWPVLDSPVTSACLDSDGATVLFATRGRQLKVFNISDRTFIQSISFRITQGNPVRGVVQQCKIMASLRHRYIIIATNEGELLTWDCSTDVIQKRGFIFSIKQPQELRVLEVFPEKGEFVVATDLQMLLLNPEGKEEFEIATPVTQCCMSQDGWLILANNAMKQVTWIKDHHRYDKSIPNYEPTSVTAGHSKGVAFVGYSRGSVLKLQPGKEPETEDGVDLFDHAVVSVITLDEERVLAASANGQFKIVRFQPVRTLRNIKQIEYSREEQFVRRLGNKDDFVSCGRNHFGDSHSSVVVVRSDDSREIVFKTKNLVLDIAASMDGHTIFILIQGKVIRFRQKILRSGWTQDQERAADITHVIICNHDFLGVVLQEKGLSWLELWSLTGNKMETVIATELPYRCESICYSNKTIAVGSNDGRHCLIHVRIGNKK